MPFRTASVAMPARRPTAGVASRATASIRRPRAAAEGGAAILVQPVPRRANRLRRMRSGHAGIANPMDRRDLCRLRKAGPIRAASFQRASGMAAADLTQERSVTGWLATTKDDPLPKARNAEFREAS